MKKLTYNGHPVQVHGYIKMRGVDIVTVEAVDDSMPFVGGKYPTRTNFKVVRLDELIIDDPCPHENTVVHTTGGMHFDGEPWDDIEESLVCIDCGSTVDEEAIHTEEMPHG